MIGRESHGQPPFNTVQISEMEFDSPGYHTALCSTEVATVFYVAESTTVKIYETEIMKFSSATGATRNVRSHVTQEHDVNVMTSQEDKDLTEPGLKSAIHCNDVQLPIFGELPSQKPKGDNTFPAMSERRAALVSDSCRDEGSTSATSISSDRHQENSPVSMTRNDMKFKKTPSTDLPDNGIEKGKNIDVEFKIADVNDVKIKREPIESSLPEEQSVKNSPAAKVVCQASHMRVGGQLTRKYPLTMSASKSKTSFNRQPLASIPVTSAMSRSSFNRRGVNSTLGSQKKTFSMGKTGDPKSGSKTGGIAKEEIAQGIVIKTEGGQNNFAALAEDTSQHNFDNVQSPPPNLGEQQEKEIFKVAVGTCVKKHPAVQNCTSGDDTVLHALGGSLAMRSKEKGGQWLGDGVSLNSEEEIAHLRGGGSTTKSKEKGGEWLDGILSNNKDDITELEGGGSASKSKETVGGRLDGILSNNKEDITELEGGGSASKSKGKGGQGLNDGVSLNSKEEITELQSGGSTTTSKQTVGQWSDEVSSNNKEDFIELEDRKPTTERKEEVFQLQDEISGIKNKREMHKLHREGSGTRSEEEIIELPEEESQIENKEIVVEFPDKLSERKNIKFLGEECNTKNKRKIVELPCRESETKNTEIIEMADSGTSTEEAHKSSTLQDIDKSLQIRKEITRKSRSFGKSNIVVQSNSGRRMETTVSCQNLNYKQYCRIFKEMLTVPEIFDCKERGSGPISTIFDKLQLSSMGKDSLTENVTPRYKGGNAEADQLQFELKQPRATVNPVNQLPNTIVTKTQAEVFEVGYERPRSMAPTPGKDTDSESKTVESQETTATVVKVHQSRMKTPIPTGDSSTESTPSTNKAPQHLIDGERKTCTTTFSEISPSSVEKEPEENCKSESDANHNTHTRSSSPSSSTTEIATNEQAESQSDGNASICTERTKIQVNKRGRPLKKVNKSFRYLKKSNLKPVINLTKASSNSSQVHRDYGTKGQLVSKKRSDKLQDSEFEDPLDTVAAHTRAKDAVSQNLLKSNMTDTASQSKDDAKQTSSDAGTNKENTHEVEQYDSRVKPCFISLRRIDSRWIQLKRKEYR